VQRAIVFTEFGPVRMIAQNRREHAVDGRTAFVQWPESHLALETDEFERRTDGDDVPARVPPRVFVSR